MLRKPTLKRWLYIFYKRNPLPKIPSSLPNKKSPALQSLPTLEVFFTRPNQNPHSHSPNSPPPPYLPTTPKKKNQNPP